MISKHCCGHDVPLFKLDESSMNYIFFLSFGFSFNREDVPSTQDSSIGFEDLFGTDSTKTLKQRL